ncbi:iron ABC transporter substrate-binding protein [Amycolatopsis tucumanensis]|uniref:iron ABC transporter substrate-binding protein n=1 Tax=Amycolatopsis tucumanensis TaxID=401106 RepID=UPI001F30398B|nr:iron ABC transporter substrate-binding protein [Amycolatopsis tucumanensis]MCF6427695.1 iron ABC transporter substrate-binding protein [Amycolatopsis tucumanensis]
MQRFRTAVAVAVSVLTAVSVSACAGSASGGDVLTLYSAQPAAKAMVDGFTQETGIKVDIRSGSDSELANQIVQEGDASPADVFVTENSPAMNLVQSKGLFARVDDLTLSQVPERFVPGNREWVGFAARSTVLVYNTKALAPDQLPGSIVDLAQPRWKDKIGIAAAGADFQAIVSAVLAVEGEAVTQQWLDGLKANAKIYRTNNAVLTAVNAGEIQAGVIYHYYWYKDRAQAGAISANTELKFFSGKDAGAFVSTSGAGVLKSSAKQAQAQQLVRYLTGRNGQQILADSNALEYTVASGVPANPKLKPFTELDPPAVDLATLNGPMVVSMMQKAGLI